MCHNFTCTYHTTIGDIELKNMLWETCVCLVCDRIIESNVRVTIAKWEMGHKSYCCN